jgi:5,10-methylenetetrahydromethanopterin reductase
MAEFWRVAFPVPGQSERMARATEAAGWDGIAFPDTQCVSGDIYSAMCLAAKATTKLQVAASVTNPATRHSSVTASAIATVQVESAGRAVLGIGRGDSSLGYIGRSPAPISTLEAYLGQVQQYLRGEAVDIDGFESRNQWIGASGQPKVPVDVAATGPRVIALGACLADRLTLALGADVERIGAAIESARATREAAGLDPASLSFGAFINIACDDDINRARAIVKGSVGTFAHFSGMSRASSAGQKDEAIYRHIGANYDMANHASGAAGHMQAVPDEFISRFGITGGVSYCADRLAELQALGLDRFVLLTGSRDSDAASAGASTARLESDVFPQIR